MATRDQVSCDVCGVDKKEVNHWRAIKFTKNVFLCEALDETNSQKNSGYQHFCGNAHAVQAFSNWLGDLGQKQE